jgi:amino-acid N-acetyltransferase
VSPDIILSSTSLRSETLGSKPDDFVALKEALDDAGLPSRDISHTGRIFWRFRDQSGRAVAYGGIEIHDNEALLRSIVTLPEARGQGFAEQVVAYLIGYARLRGFDRVWLLTTGAAEFFHKLGFRESDRASVPTPIAATVEFTSLSQASAICMSRALWR